MLSFNLLEMNFSRDDLGERVEGGHNLLTPLGVNRKLWKNKNELIEKIQKKKIKSITE